MAWKIRRVRSQNVKRLSDQALSELKPLRRRLSSLSNFGHELQALISLRALHEDITRENSNENPLENDQYPVFDIAPPRQDRTATTIHRFSPEILVRIFRCLLAPDCSRPPGGEAAVPAGPHFQSIVAVSGVCKLWRMITLFLPDLWASVGPLYHPEAARIFLSRARSAPLTAYILFRPYDRRVNHVVEHHLPRFRHVVVADTARDVFDPPPMRIIRDARLPHLETLSLHGNGNAFDLPPKFDCPRLRVLRLDDVNIDWNAWTAFPSLTTLSLSLRDRHASRATLDELCRLLHNAPQLETLRMSDASPWVVRGTGPKAGSLSLPNIRSITIEENWKDVSGPLTLLLRAIHNTARRPVDLQLRFNRKHAPLHRALRLLGAAEETCASFSVNTLIKWAEIKIRNERDVFVNFYACNPSSAKSLVTTDADGPTATVLPNFAKENGTEAEDWLRAVFKTLTLQELAGVSLAIRVDTFAALEWIHGLVPVNFSGTCIKHD